jgi:hypothetical protein
MTLRTDLAITPLPPTPLFSGLNGAGDVAEDPTFKTHIVRVTDGNTFAGQSLFTDFSPNRLMWNMNDTMFAIKHPGNACILYELKSGGPIEIGGGYPARIAFSSLYHLTLFSLEGSKIFKYDFPKVGSNSPVKSVICDFAGILPAGFTINWAGNFSHSIDDTTFCASFSQGVQDTGYLVCVYRAGYGLRMLNTSTGQISGDWGQIGIATGQTWGKNVHDALMSGSPDYCCVSIVGVDSPSIWDISTIQVTPSKGSGHNAKGYAHFYEGGTGTGQFLEVAYASPGVSTPIVPASMLPGGQTPPQVYTAGEHAGFGKIAKDDESIFWVSHYDNPSPFTSCWQGEIDGYMAAGAKQGTVYRACHTYNSGLSTEFAVLYAIANPSQTGKYVAFCSDMMGSLGKNPAGGNRGDVFIVSVG